MKKIIFISWTSGNRHTTLFAKALNAEVFYISKHFDNKKDIHIIKVFADYLIKTLKTLVIIIKNAPHIVFVQNPPSLCPIVVVFLSKIIKFKVVIDSHNGAFETPWVNVPFHSWALRHAYIVTIHNSILHRNLLNIPKFTRVNFHVISSKLMKYNASYYFNSNEPYFLVICSFSKDEPMAIVLEGIKMFLNTNKNYKFKITGDYKRQYNIYKKFNDNLAIEFLGFVEDNNFTNLLKNSFGTMSFSTRNDVQQFALMESISFGIPFISNINDTNVLLFKDEMILTELTPLKICESINKFIECRDKLEKRIDNIYIRLSEKWEEDFQLLLTKLQS